MHTYTHTHRGKEGNLILPLWFDSSNCSNDSSVVLWVLWMSPEPVISAVGTRGWERMLLQPTKWPLNHRLWSHSGLWKSVHLLLDVSGVCVCGSLCPLLAACRCDQVEIVWIKIVRMHGCDFEVHIVLAKIVRHCVTNWSTNCECKKSVALVRSSSSSECVFLFILKKNQQRSRQ